MITKKIDKDPFSNGTETVLWYEHNCDRCIKASHYNKKKEEFTKYRCAIQRDIETRMYCDEPINERTIKICDEFIRRGTLCPLLQIKRKKYMKKDKNQMNLAMTVEEKIRDILNRHYGYEVMAGTDLWFTKQYQDRFAHLLEMAEWKDEQLINKACEWLTDALMSDEGGFPITYSGIKEFISDFKQAMKE